MKKKIFTIAAFATLLINAKAVNANELITEVETDKYTITDKTEVGKITKLDLHLNGTEIKDNTYYYVYFSNSNSEDIKSKITSQATGECQIETDYKDFSKFFSVNNDSSINVNDDWYMLNGYNYVYVVKQSYVEEEGNYCEINKKPIYVEKTKLPKLTQRYQYFLFDEANRSSKEDSTFDIFTLFPESGDIGNHKKITKIGLINDKDLLRKLSKNESGSLEELIEYAKKSEGTKYESDSENYNDIKLGNFNVINGAYYYIYTTYVNEEGLFRDLSDITIVMGEADMLVNDVKWNLDDEKDLKIVETPKEKKKEEIKNPKTGIEKPYVVAIAFVLVASIGLVFLNRKKIFSK